MPDILNRVLRSFTLSQLDKLVPIEPVTYQAGDVIYCQNEPVSHLIFVDSGLVSVARHIDGGYRPVVIVVSGGFHAVIGTHTVLQRAAEGLYDYTALIRLHGWRVHRTAIHSVMADDVAFAQQMQALVRTSHTTIADIAACRGVHSVEQRFCRQLVMLHRAMGSEHIPVTRPMLAEMVPLSRGHAFRVAASLRGIVTFRVDSLTIDDLEALEHRACRCVQVLAEREAGIGES